MELDVFDLALTCEILPKKDRQLLISYYSQNMGFLLKQGRVDKEWYSDKIMGITLEPMILLKERLLKDHRFIEALTDLKEMKPYFAEKYRVYLGNINGL